jgi:hypothetical protein
VEGCVGAADCGTANLGYELTFCPDSTMSLCVGDVAAVSGNSGASSGVAWVGTFVLAANTRYTFNGFDRMAEGFKGGQAPLGCLLSCGRATQLAGRWRLRRRVRLPHRQ